MNRVTRHIAGAYLVQGTQTIRSGVAILWKATGPFKEGLTPKEKKYLEKRMATIQLACDDIYNVLYQRVNQTGRTR